MRVAFTGKGGSGKTTVSSLFACVAANDSHKVLALDADINQHLADALGYDGRLRSMGTDADSIKEYLRGDNPLLQGVTMHKSTPPGRGSRLLRLASDDWFLREFAVQHDGVWLAGAGDIPEGNVGIRCYHGLNGAVELVLGHLIDRQDDIVITDMTAGADAFSSSLFTKVDALVLVVEPTLKSLSVHAQFARLVVDYDIPLIVVGNKIVDESDKVFIREHIPDVALWIETSAYVRDRERGRAGGSIEPTVTDTLRELRTQLVKKPIDWRKREELSYRMHRRAVEQPVIDPEFSLAKAAE